MNPTFLLQASFHNLFVTEEYYYGSVYNNNLYQIVLSGCFDCNHLIGP